jgi:hypothetical protein
MSFGAATRTGTDAIEAPVDAHLSADQVLRARMTRGHLDCENANMRRVVIDQRRRYAEVAVVGAGTRPTADAADVVSLTARRSSPGKSVSSGLAGACALRCVRCAR